jgi:hypothetical protein
MSIAVGEAAFAGFRLIGRNPLTVLVWGVIYLIFLGIPSALLFAWVGPAYLEMFKAMGSGANADPNAVFGTMLPVMQKAQLVSSVAGLLSLVVRAVLVTAVLRAVLEPEKKGFFYMKLGMEEVLQGLLSFAMAFILVFIAFGVLIVGGIVFALMGLLPSQVAWIARVVTVIVALVAFVVIALRLSLAPPMTFAEKNFRLFESWKLTKGHAGALFLVVLVLIIFVWILEAVVAILFFAMLAAGHETLRSMFANQNPAEVLKSIAPAMVVTFAVFSLLGGAFLAIFVAPFATVYKQITGNPPAAQTFT